MKYDVTALGEILIDYTPCGRNEYGYPMYIQNPGGGPVNLAAAVAAFGGKSAYIGKVGDDAQGRFLIDCLKKAGVDASGVCADPEYNTTLAFVTLYEDGGRDFTFYWNHEAHIRLSRDEVPYETIENSRVMHISSLTMTHEPARTATWEAIKRAKEAGVLISYDPNYRSAIWSAEDALAQINAVLPYVDIVKFSEEEAEMVAGTPDLEKCAEYFHSLGIKLCALTLGKDGAYISGRGVSFRNPAYTKDIVSVDTTGAGDIFWGSFLSRLVKEDDMNGALADEAFLKKAFSFASAAAGMSTAKKGGVPSVPKYEDVLAVL
ncbi:MAG: carbohydrate kinase [Ruminococcaceae bacterium]|nr:carbohydrate kinase [Oscillospiraceae bacterium]